MSAARPDQVEIRGIAKSFGDVHVLDSVTLTIRPNSFHAVIGENGAGKSTLAKCMLGVYGTDAGEIRIGDTRIETPAQAQRAGLGMVFQNFNLVPSMTVAENLLLARKDIPAFFNRRKEMKRLRLFLESAPFQIDLDSIVAHLAAGQKQKVEILKQLYLDTRILILDEPTSVLTPGEADEVMTVLAGMVKSGKLSVILISHKFREVMNYADEVSVLRAGRMVKSVPVAETNLAELSEAIMGHATRQRSLDKSTSSDKGPSLELCGLSVVGDSGILAVKNVSLRVTRGEIVGIAGVSGNGQRELVQAIAGQKKIESGRILAFGRQFRPRRREIIEAGLFTLPEEPLESATVASMTVEENMALRRFDRPPLLRWRWFMSRVKITRDAASVIKSFSIRPPHPGATLRHLSGGNLRKVVLGRELIGYEVKILVVANPTVGLDLGATAFLHERLIELRNRGGALLVISEDLDELMTLSDRIVVMSGGVLAYEVETTKADRTIIGSYFGGETSHPIEHESSS